MLVRKEVAHATDLDLLTVLIGDRKKATKLFAKAKFSLFALLHAQPTENGDLFCSEGSSAYGMNRSSNCRQRLSLQRGHSPRS